MGQIAAMTLGTLPTGTFEIFHCADTRIHQLYGSMLFPLLDAPCCTKPLALLCCKVGNALA